VATQVFDDNAHIEDPLQILDLKELQEENLKLVTNPLLGKEAHRIRRSFAVPAKSGPAGAKSGTNLLETKSAKSLHAVESSDDEAISIPEGVEVHAPLKDKIMNCLGCCVCCCCKRQSLRDAALIRQTNRENAFMEERCNSYERRRSQEIDMEAGPLGPLRERSHSVSYSAACRESVLRANVKGFQGKANKGSSKVVIQTPEQASSPQITVTPS